MTAELIFQLKAVAFEMYVAHSSPSRAVCSESILVPRTKRRISVPGMHTRLRSTSAFPENLDPVFYNVTFLMRLTTACVLL